MKIKSFLNAHRLEAINVCLIAAVALLVPLKRVPQYLIALLAVQGVILLIRQKKRIFESVAQRRFGLLFLLYWVPVMISMIGAEWFSKPIGVAFGHLPYYFGGLFIIHFLEARNRWPLLSKILFIGIAVWFAEAYFQLLFGFNFRGMPREQVWLGGPFWQATKAGYYFTIFSPFLLFYPLQRNAPRWVLGLLYLLTAVVVLLANSRTAWLVFAVISLIYLWQAFIRPFRHKVAILAAIAFVGVLALTGLYHTSSTVRIAFDQSMEIFNGDIESLDRASSSRLTLWRPVVKVIADNPINGVGARNLRYAYPRYAEPDDIYLFPCGTIGALHEHQLVLEILVSTGIIGLAAFLGAWFFCIRWWRGASAVQRTDALPLASVLIGIYMPIFVHTAHYSSESAQAHWFLLALFMFLPNRPLPHCEDDG